MRYVYRFECINVYLFIFVHTQHQVWVREQGVREEEQRLQRDRERLHAVVRDAELRHQRRHKAAEEARQTHLYIHKCVCIYKYIQHIYFSCVRGCRAVSVLMYVSVFMHVCANTRRRRRHVGRPLLPASTRTCSSEISPWPHGSCRRRRRRRRRRGTRRVLCGGACVWRSANGTSSRRRHDTPRVLAMTRLTCYNTPRVRDLVAAQASAKPWAL